MRTQARIVIIGAGIAGTATAYHLAELGVTDVVVIDQGPLWRTGGSTSHAPGGMFQTNSSRTMSAWARYTIGLFAGLEVDGRSGAAFLGGIELAETRERLQDLKRRRGLQQSWGIPGEILGPSEVKRHIPIIDETKILGGLYVPDDCIGRPLLAAEAMGRHAAAAGIDFHGEVTVTGFERANGRVSAVVTDQGRIEAEMVLCCAGIWGPKIGRLAGVPIALQPMQHQYVKTAPLGPLAELSQGGTVESAMPLIRAQDHSLYFRQHFDHFGIGNYRHAPLPVNAEDLLPFRQAPRMPSCMDFTPEHFEECHRASVNLFPLLKDAAQADAFNGIFSFPPDGMPLMGEHADLPGFWVCEGVWITHSAGIGRSMAHWMIEGDPGIDIREADVNRFTRFQTTPTYVRERGGQQYREVYDIIHPMAQPSVARGLRTSPMHDRHLANGAHFWEVGGWERPAWFEVNAGLAASLAIAGRSGWAGEEFSPIQGAEALATRKAAGLYDVSTFTKLEVEGADAAAFLNHALANDIDKPVGSVVYTCMLNTRGGVISDMVVARTGETAFLILTGTGSGLSDLAHLKRIARSPAFAAADIAIRNVTEQYCGIGLWGPKVRDILAAVTDADLSDGGFGYYRTKEIDIGPIRVRALRISYAGEFGYEFYMPAPNGRAVWDRLVAAGAPHDLVVCGIGALDSLRIEKGYRLAGADLHGDRTPLEAGLGWSVAMKKADFIGRAALAAQKAAGVPTRLTCLTLDDEQAVVLGKEPVLREGKAVGYVTSANTGYSIGRTIAYAYLPTELARPGEAFEIEFLGTRLAATVVAEPLYDPSGSRLKG